MNKRTMLEFIELKPTSKDSFSADKQWRDIAYRTWRCQCARPKVGFKGPIDVIVQNPRRKMAVDFVFGFAGFAVAAVNLVERLGKELVFSAFDVGTISGADGRVSPDLVTLRSKHESVFLRGGKDSTKRLCPECGRLLYLAVGEAYLCDVDQKQLILQEDFGNILLRSDFFESRLQGFPLPHVKLARLEVRNSTSDGLPISVDNVVKMLQSREPHPETGPRGKKRSNNVL